MALILGFHQAEFGFSIGLFLPLLGILWLQHWASLDANRLNISPALGCYLPRRGPRRFCPRAASPSRAVPPVCVCVCVCVCACVCVCVCVCVCIILYTICIYRCLRIHTHTHTHVSYINKHTKERKSAREKERAGEREKDRYTETDRQTDRTMAAARCASLRTRRAR